MIFSGSCLSWTDELALIHAVIPQIIAHPELAGVRNSGAVFSHGFLFFFFLAAFPFQLDHHLILLLVVQLHIISF